MVEVSHEKEDKDEYIKNTSVEASNIDIDERFISGTLEITPALAKQCKIAVESRIEACKPYTIERIGRINDDRNSYYQKKKTDDASVDVFFGETWNSVEDWVADLYLIFVDFVESIRVKDNGSDIEEFITKALPNKFESNSIFTRMFASLAEFIFKKENLRKEEAYYFNKNNAIKSLLKYAVNKSGFKLMLEEFLRTGVNTGMFLFKD